MNGALPIIIAVAYGYLVGAIPTAYLVARFKKGIDIRRYGSGNVGASNIGHHLGRRWFVMVAAFDILVKGSASVGLARLLGLDLTYQALAGFMAVVGHSWSGYLKFSGGRGLSVAGGGLLILAWKEMLASLVVAAAGWLIFRSTALWFGIALVLLPIWALVFREPGAIVGYCLALVAATTIKRLLSNPGTAPPGLRWRDMAIPRLLHDRDTPRAGNWVKRTPEEEKGRDE